MAKILLKRGTRAQLNAARTAKTLAAGEPYLITDESSVAIGTANNQYVDVGPIDQSWVGRVTAALDKLFPSEYPSWSTDRKNGSIALSNSNLTATFNGSAQASLLAAIGADGSEKGYFEVTFNSGSGSGDCSVGLTTIDEGLAVQVGFNGSSTSASIFQTSGNIYVNLGGYAQISGGFGTANNTVCVAYDAGTKQIWFKINNSNWRGSSDGSNPGVGSGIPISGVTGKMYPAMGSPASAVFTLNLGATAFKYTKPTGFSAWKDLQDTSGW